MAKIVFPLPDRDFDVTEVAVPWKLLTEAGHEIVFATERAGTQPACDPLLLSGVLFGQLGAAPEPKAFYAELCASPAFAATRAFGDLTVAEFDAVVLAGGHAPGMRPYLENEALFAFVRDFSGSGKVLGAICHGVLVAARAGALAGKKTTCLPKYMERSAYFLTAWKLGRYYRTYPAYVEDEVKAALTRPEDFVRGPRTLASRGTRNDARAAFVVEDGAYVSARWPGDAYLFAQKIAARLV